MAPDVTYWKPNMAALPNDIGRKIIDEIMHSKPADQKAIHERNEKVREAIRQRWEQEKNGEKE